MNIHDELFRLTSYVRETKGSGEALKFYVKHIQPIKAYFGGDNAVKKLTIPDVSNNEAFSDVAVCPKCKNLGIYYAENFETGKTDRIRCDCWQTDC